MLDLAAHAASRTSYRESIQILIDLYGEVGEIMAQNRSREWGDGRWTGSRSTSPELGQVFVVLVAPTFSNEAVLDLQGESLSRRWWTIARITSSLGPHHGGRISPNSTKRRNNVPNSVVMRHTAAAVEKVSASAGLTPQADSAGAWPRCRQGQPWQQTGHRQFNALTNTILKRSPWPAPKSQADAKFLLPHGDHECEKPVYAQAGQHDRNAGKDNQHPHLDGSRFRFSGDDLLHRSYVRDRLLGISLVNDLPDRGQQMLRWLRRMDHQIFRSVIGETSHRDLACS